MQSILATVGIALLGITAASAHVTIEPQQAMVGSAYRAVVIVPHGCAGSPTLKLRVQIPNGVIAVKPQPKAGWTLETVSGKYGQTFDYFGTPISEGVKEIAWSGRLLDENYDEFIFRAYLTSDLQPGTKLYVRIVQECEKGVSRWIEVPTNDTSSDAFKFPAPAVQLIPRSDVPAVQRPSPGAR
ncbi:YcnI family protein [Bradyrhizobium sp. GCM10027634]|uniref:YcnI family copper-binding membrane protein n=1 Tax=unclassified Bradyrhizobium TaxID=2631580 RepID=UPI001FF003DE|nr:MULTISPECIES: DUF1775 domain-containing protein [unclassified Bradyrhizobium]MDN5004046.1 DUF1775 domain-containing protein [Bradyrhizobium sp. WYCCWR 12677]